MSSMSVSNSPLELSVLGCFLFLLLKQPSQLDMSVNGSFSEFTEEAAAYLCTPQQLTAEGLLQLEMRSLSGKVTLAF